MITKPKTVPELRFPGVEGAIETHPLGTVTRVIDCKHRTPDYVEKGVPIVSPGTIRWGEIDLISPTKRVIESEYISLMDHCDPQIGDMVLSRNQSLGVASRITSNEKFVLGQDTVLLQQKNGNGGIVFYRLQTSGTQAHITKLSGGSTFSRINLKDIRLLPLSLPADRAEQRKIADFLTAVDGRIGQLSQKKALLEDYKKGVMQQLFTQALRFKDDHGNDFPEWEEKRLVELCATFKSGKGITSEQIQEAGEYPVFGGNGLRGYTNTFTHDGVYLLIGRQGALCGNINRVSGKAFISEHAIAVAGNNLADTEWLAQRLDQLKLNRLSESSAQPGLAVNKLERLKLSTPSLPEQTKIANFLTALDRKIESVSSQITGMQTWKKGLLQQMFV